MTTVVIRSAFNREFSNPIFFQGPGRTKQAHAEESDINYIMAKYLKSGHLEHANKHAGEYGFASSDDFHGAMNVVVKAQAMFDELPATTRRRFGNSPTMFLDFVQNPDNAQEMSDLGLKKQVTPVKPAPTPPPEENPNDLPTSD